jgi:hypothetical protein
MMKDRTTYALEHMINNFTWYPNEILSRAKRELDRRYRIRTIKLQNEIAKKNFHPRSTGS